MRTGRRRTSVSWASASRYKRRDAARDAALPKAPTHAARSLDLPTLTLTPSSTPLYTVAGQHVHRCPGGPSVPRGARGPILRSLGEPEPLRRAVDKHRARGIRPCAPRRQSTRLAAATCRPRGGPSEERHTRALADARGAADDVLETRPLQIKPVKSKRKKYDLRRNLRRPRLDLAFVWLVLAAALTAAALTAAALCWRCSSRARSRARRGARAPRGAGNRREQLCRGAHRPLSHREPLMSCS